MNTKNFICILASAALLVSCAIHLPAGKRTEQVGRVIGLTDTQITLTNSAGTWIISRTDSCLRIVSGSLAVANTVDIIFCVPASCCPTAPITH